jgi:uncharacterized protein
MAHYKIDEKSNIPLVGCLAFGIIDRGTNLIQIRPTSLCNQKCPFCSTNANNLKVHPHTYEIEKGYLIKWIKKVIKEKESDEIETNIDSVGEITTHPKFIELIKEVKKIKEVKRISLQTNGLTLTKEKLNKIKGHIDRVNLSFHTLDKEQAKYLAGTDNYNIEKIKETAEYAIKQGIEVFLTPVWLPKINDNQIEKIIEYSNKIGAKIGIQNYEQFKYGRKIKGSKAITFWKFFDKLKRLEKETKTKLILGKEDFKIKKTKRVPTTMETNEIIHAEIKIPGWVNNQMIAVANDRCITINNCKDEIGTFVKLKITDNKNNIYLAKKF